MTQRERLIELLDECRGIEGIGMELVEKHADLLLANGVIVPPCKVGDTVYQIDGVRIYESEVCKIIYDTGHIAFDEDAIGKSIFLTGEEAEKALEGKT